MTLVLGDVHGRFDLAEQFIGNMLRAGLPITQVIQMGDFGVGFEGDKPWNYPVEFPNLYFVDGNHDNHDLLQGSLRPFYPFLVNRVEYLPRGAIIDVEGCKALCLGGAASVDKPWRIEGKTWWAKELITYQQAQDAIDGATEAGGIDMMLTHEMPDDFPCFDQFKGTHYESQGQRNLLKGVRRALSPKIWIFGHYHEPKSGEHNGCQWYCAPDVRTGLGLIIDGPKISWCQGF